MATAHPIMTPRRKANQQRNIDEFTEHQTELASRPLTLFVELTQNCNLRCPSCRSQGPYRRDWNMPREVFDQLADELFEDALIVDLRGWGESLVYPRFASMAERVLNSGAQLRIVTNGQVDKPELWDKMMSCGSIVSLSCDAASEELFSVLRAGGTLKRLKQTASNLVKYRDLYGMPPELLSLYVVVSRPNLSELSDIVRLAESVGISRVTFAPIQMGQNHPWNLRHDVEGVKHALDAAAEEARARDVELHLASSLDVSLNLTDDVKQLCMHPWSYAYISYEGRVGFCDHLIGLSNYTFGSLTEQSFDEIWNGEQWQRLRAQHAQQDIGDEFSPCKWCYKQRYVDFEHLVHPSYFDHFVSTKTRPALCGFNPQAAEQEASFLQGSQVETTESWRMLPLATQ